MTPSCTPRAPPIGRDLPGQQPARAQLSEYRQWRSLTVDGAEQRRRHRHVGATTAPLPTTALRSTAPGYRRRWARCSLNSRLVVNTADVEALTLEGFDGDDTFTLVPAISASVYPTINLNGGGQASATGDRVNLIGTTVMTISSSTARQVALVNTHQHDMRIEDIRLDARGGNDLITYNGVSGVTENIKVSSSGVAGGGQLSVPGVTLVDFTGVETDRRQRQPTPTRGGYADLCRHQRCRHVPDQPVRRPASDADPILKLQNAAGTTTLLTLRNYTNFNTLNVLGLDGNDTFNVTTANSIPSTPPLTGRNLFVDGGLPTGKKKSTDNLNVFYTRQRPHIIQSAATQNPDAGIVDLDYGTARFVVQYNDVEQVVIRKR